MKTTKIISAIALGICCCLPIAAETNTYYFMDEVPMRSSMNPAFMPNTQFYLDFIIMPSFSLEAGNNALAFKDIIYKKDGNFVTPLHASDGVDKLYKRFKRANVVDMNFNMNILEFGFRFREKNYLTFGLDLNLSSNVVLPRDMFNLALYGTPSEFGVNSFNFKRFGLDMELYSEFGVGYMRRINEQWTVGGKVSLLMGYAGAKTKVRTFKLDASRDSWDVTADADAYLSAPLTFGQKEDGTIDFGSAELKSNYLELLYKPAGHGASFDVGFTYEPIKHLVVSAAITDLGFIYWHRNVVSGHADGVYSFTGIEYEPGDSVDFAKMGDDALDALHFKSEEKGGFAQMIHGNFNAAVEYGILKNKISFGLLSHMRFNAQYVSEEVTLAANFRPLDWLKAYLSYSFVNSRGNNLGLGLSLRAGPINMFLAMDYIPLYWAKTQFEVDGSKYPIPYGTQRFNVQMGMNLSIGRDSGDKDRDGVKNIDDQCPGTPIKQLRKLCPDVKRKNFVDSVGCLLDEDQDGVPDCYDQCPGTPFGWPVDSVGCPFDSDKDGVPDCYDECPDTPFGVMVDSKGCPLDEDKDGVPDHLDKCPGTPIGVQVDENGCPIDSDGDGVPDYLDKCPNTPVEAYTTIDENGCPKDSDGDGVPDYLDKCPTVAGSPDNYGCPELKREVRNLFKRAMQGIQFETGKDVILSRSFPILDAIANVMFENPTFNLTINGHTDNVGKDETNQLLSERRAASVRRYLIGKGVAEERMTSNGFGATIPIADNKTKAGRALNRRVEFLVTYEEITYEKVENPELQGIQQQAEPQQTEPQQPATDGEAQ